MSTHVFSKLKILKSEMEKNDWTIDAFNFNYKDTVFVVLIKLYTKEEEKTRPKYDALLKVEFIKLKNFEALELHATSYGFILDVKEFRGFFNINYSDNLGDVFKQFNQYFAKFIPTQVKPRSKELEDSVTKIFDERNKKNSTGKYCFSVKRNENKRQRSLENGNKTAFLRPELFSKFKDDTNISFNYSEDSSREKSDAEILFNFSKNRDKH